MVKINLINSRFIKINGTRNPGFSGETSTKTNIKILNIESLKDSKIFQVKYSFEINYSGLGEIYLEGVVFISGDQKFVKDTQNQWKNKKIGDENYVLITNIIIQKASLKAFELEEELGLPIHIRLPKIAKN